MLTARAPETVLFAYGTRPEAIKLAPIIRLAAECSQVTNVVAVSGQHREMLDQVHRAFSIATDYDLDLMRPHQSLTDITVAALVGYRNLIEDVGPSIVVVQGDTTTAFAASLASYYCQVPVVHVEAGLRTGDIYNPFPEEINRKLISQLAALHLAPTAQNKQNLITEGVHASSIRVTGNTVIDALLHTANSRSNVGVPSIDAAIADKRRIVLVTAHRRESWGEPLVNIARALLDLALRYPDVFIVLPLHRNPAVRSAIRDIVDQIPNIYTCEPLGYVPFVSVMAAATVVLTDSGGVQEEAPSLGKPVLVLRETTERREAIESGTAHLVGTNTKEIVRATAQILDNPNVNGGLMQTFNPYGDGQASVRSLAAILNFLGIGSDCQEYLPGLGEAKH